MGKDRVKPLFTVLSTGDPSRFREEGLRAIQEIQEEQKELNRDIRLIQDLLTRYGGAADGLTPAERSAKIRQAALAIAKGGKETFTTQEVVDYIRDTEGLVFAVRRPASVVGTVLHGSDDFEQVEMGLYRLKEMCASDSRTD